MSKLEEQINYFRQLLAGKAFTRDSLAFGAVLGWIKQYPGSLTGEEVGLVKQLVCSCFNMEELEFFELLRSSNLERRPDGVQDYGQIEAEFDSLIPNGGWLRSYIEFTRNLESPFAYHLYCGLV